MTRTAPSISHQQHACVSLVLHNVPVAGRFSPAKRDGSERWRSASFIPAGPPAPAFLRVIGFTAIAIVLIVAVLAADRKPRPSLSRSTITSPTEAPPVPPCYAPAPVRNLRSAPVNSSSKVEVVSHGCAKGTRWERPPGMTMWAACSALLRSGIGSLHTQGFLSTDGVVFVGNPADEGKRVGAPDAQALTSDELISGGALPFEELIVHAANLKGTFRQITVEPTGRLLRDKATLLLMMEQVAEYPHAQTRVVLAISEVSLARTIKERHPNQLVATIVSGALAQEDSNHHQLCNSKLTLDARILLFEPFDILITTLDAVELPGCVEAIPVLAGLGKRVITRGVDDPGTLASVIDTSSGGFVNAVITRDPEAIAPECEKARKARDAAMKARNSRRRKQ